MQSHENPRTPFKGLSLVNNAVEHALDSGLTIEEAEQTIEPIHRSVFREVYVQRIKEQDQQRLDITNALADQKEEQFVNTTGLFRVAIAFYLLGVVLFVILAYFSGKDAPLVQFAFPVIFAGMVCSTFSIVHSLIKFKKLDDKSKRNLFWNVILLLPFLIYYSAVIIMINTR